MPYVVTLPNHKPIFGVIYGKVCSEQRIQNDTCYEEIGLCAQNMLTILQFNGEHHHCEGLCNNFRILRS